MIQVVFFAQLREIVGLEKVEFEILEDDEISVATIVSQLSDTYPVFGQYLDDGHQFLSAVNQEVVTSDCKLKSGDELAFFPPVTGG